MFLRRGKLPANLAEIGNIDNTEDVVRRFWLRRMTTVPLDNTYVIMQMIVTFIILIIGILAIIFNYKPIIEDPISNIKAIFLNSYLISLFICLGVIICINKFSKTYIKLLNRLVLMIFISTIILFTFIALKINLDKTYTLEKFESFYNSSNEVKGENKKVRKNKQNNNKKINIGIKGITLKDEKQEYIDESMYLYQLFSIKYYIFMVANLIIIGMVIYQIFKIIGIKSKKEEIERGDIALWDTEQNIK